MICKALLIFLVFVPLAAAKQIFPTLLLPIRTTINTTTQYSLGFKTDASVPHSASISITFPFEFDPRGLINYSQCKLKRGTGQLIKLGCSLSNRTFLLPVGSISSQQLIIVTIGNILNPSDFQMSSHFSVSVLFKTVAVTENFQFGKVPFSTPPVDQGASLVVYNHDNILVDQGSSWVFQFTPSTTYPVNTTIRFVFPDGFSSSKVQCNITGISDPALRSRSFPNKRVYDCLNINGQINGPQEMILSGIVNPNYKMTVGSIELHIMQPNSIIALQKFSMQTPIEILEKQMNVSVVIPNKYRNNTITYIFQLNMDSNLYAGDYVKIEIEGNWTVFLQDSKFIEGINSDSEHTPKFVAEYKWPTSTNIYIQNFSSILKSSQSAFYLSFRTPLTSNFYVMKISAVRSHGGLVEYYEQTLEINSTTGYIRQMRMHPMVQTIKLPVGRTGPLEITLGLRQNLPQTNVLTYGKFIIKITPNLPKPDVNINGVPKCYFYGDIEAKNCTYDDTDPDFSLITVFTPVDFNFQSSQIPFMVTTEGYIDPQYEGITIDTLVKRYHFHIQFYTQYRPEPIPTQVIFGDWVPDSIPLTTFSCEVTSRAERTYDHLRCTFTTPSQDLNEPEFVHIFRLQFTSASGYYGWDDELGYSANQIYPNYPCIGYGTNLVADPYIKCDLITYTSGPYAAGSSRSYINIYGFELLPAGSEITLQLPRLQRHSYYWQTKILFSILEDTYGYQTDFITLYSQTIDVAQTYSLSTYYDSYFDMDVTYTLTNPVINKVTNLTLVSLDLTQSGITHIILEVDQTTFEDIGREHHIECGQHMCSKFNKPIQYFILYPSRTLNQYESLTFPFIVTPDRSGEYEFRLRLYKSGSYIANWKFLITIDPEILSPPIYQFHTVLEPENVLYPNTLQYFSIQWTTINPLPASKAFIKIVLQNNFKLASDYCVITTTALAFDDRGIECEIWVDENQIYLQHMAAVPSGTDFQIDLQLQSIDTAASISPQVSIYTYYDVDILVDMIENSGFTGTSISNTNLETFSTFQVKNPVQIPDHIRKGYFGHLLLNIKPRNSNSISKGQVLLLTFTNDFYPSTNQLGLPMICKIKGIRYPCTYTLNPFTVSIDEIANSMTLGADNEVNITTEYLQHNGIYHPALQGRYLISAKIYNNTYNQITYTYQLEVYEYVEEYIDIWPNPIKYFNATFAHLDTGLHNIFTFQFRTGNDPIPAYNDGTQAGRIYIGFPTTNDANGNVFEDDLGFQTGLGTVIPCWFESGLGYITPLSLKQLECRLITSPYSSRFTFVEIINFDSLAPGTNAKIIMAKILNPAIKQIDINFKIKVNTVNPASLQETTLYQSDYNMFFNMLGSSITYRSEVDSTTVMFEPGSRVGDSDKYFLTIPYSATSFSEGDWFVIDMSTDFPLNGDIIGCQTVFYEHCIIYKEINWLAVRIGNTTLLELNVFIEKLPTSISRVDTTYKAFTFKSSRWAQTITYTIKAIPRWLQLRGEITGFKFEVLGSHDKLNINQKNVDVMVTFTVSHPINRGGSIQIQFPNNRTFVPSIKPHCRSAITLGSALNGDPGRSSENVQGDVGCLIEGYSWIITSFDELEANKQVKIIGQIDFPTIQTASLGMGFVVTYSDAVSNSFANGRIIDYGTFNFPLETNNKTWQVDTTSVMYRSQPLRINHKGELKFKLNLGSTLYGYANGGYLDISTWRVNTMGYSGGFSGPTSNMVCKILRMDTLQAYGCYVSSAGAATNYYYYRIQSYENLPANADYEFTLTTQNGNSNEGLNFPSSTGVYKIEISVQFSSGSTAQVSQPHFVQVYGPNFITLNFISTVDIPDEMNMIICQFRPSSTINTNQQFIIEIPTVGIDGGDMFPRDLGMGYSDYDDLVFDIFESDISSMQCKVYCGDKTNSQPVKIICSNFNTAVTSSMTVKMGFWVKNPTTTKGLAIPVQIYSFDTLTARKDCWSILEAGIRVLPTSAVNIADLGNFLSSSTYRQIDNRDFSFTTRNTRALQKNDLYILKFSFDLRKEQSFAGKFDYNSGFVHQGDVIFMRKCQTIILRVGLTALNIMPSGSTTKNAKITGIFYNPKIQLSSSEKIITAYAIYLNTKESEKIMHNDEFPTLVPQQMSSPSFSFVSIHGNTYQGQAQDYRISFAFSTSTAGDMALVKKISIQFPPFSTHDLKFKNNECIEDTNSQIEIENCYIDTATYTIWLTPAQKTTYINSHNFIIQTKGLAIQNPTIDTSINLANFVIRYYTWDGSSEPVLLPNLDDYAFFKADSTYISGTTSFTSNTYPKHDYLSIPQQIYVNQFEPASTDLSTDRMKTPFEFTFIAMASFSDLSSSNNYHLIRVTYSSYFSSESQQRTEDLNYYVPTCHLNGALIHSCVLTSGRIEMKFQQAISIGSHSAVRFSVLNPKDAADDGFFLTSLSNSLITLPIQFFPYGGSSYYGQAQPFNTYYRTSAVSYPQIGITYATVVSGTQVYRALNYLEFDLTFSRGDINGLVLEIPVISKDGTVIYNNANLMGLQSGSDYPCSIGINVDVYCYYEAGSSSQYGRPTRIYITRFSMPADNRLSFRMLFTNPDNIGVIPTFLFKAYGGSGSNFQIMGDQFMGSYEIIGAFKTLPELNYYSTDTCTARPDKALWNRQTTYKFYIDHTQYAQSYVILQWVLNDPTYGEFSEYELQPSQIRDYFTISDSFNTRKLYLVRKITSTYSGSSSTYHSFGYLRSKHFKYNSQTVYLLKNPSYSIITCSVSFSEQTANFINNQYGQASIQYLDLGDRLIDQNTWQYLSVYIGNAKDMMLDDGDPADFIVAIKFIENKMFNYFLSTYECSIQNGVTSTDPLKPVTCELQNSPEYQIILRNVNKFVGNYLKVYYKVRTLTTNVQGVKVEVRAYANSQSYEVSGGWALFISSTAAYNTFQMFYRGNLGYNQNMTATSDGGAHSQMFSTDWVDYDGYAKILSVTTTQIQVEIEKGSIRGFNGDWTYQMQFRFYTERFDFSTCQSVSISGSGSYPAPITCGGVNKHFWVIYSYYGQNYFGWPSWTNTQKLTFTFTFANIAGDVAEENVPDYWFLSATVNYFRAVYYGRHSICGSRYRSYTCCCSIFGCLFCQTTCTDFVEYYECTFFYDYYTMVFTSRSDGLNKASTLSLSSSVNINALSTRYSAQTELEISVNSFNYAVGSSDNSYLLFHYHNNPIFPDNNPFPATRDADLAAYIDCKCFIGSSINSGTTYSHPKCVRYKPLGMNPSIGVFIDVGISQTLKCFFPGILNPSSTSNGQINIDTFKQNIHYFNRYIPRSYFSRYAYYNAEQGLNSYGTSGFSPSENAFWSNTHEAYSTGYYDLNISGNTLTYPIVYMSMYGPKPLQSFCSSGFFFCRAYTSFVNRRYYLTAQSTSHTYLLRFSGTCEYPPTDDVSSDYYRTYVAWCDPSSHYYVYSATWTRSSGYLNAATPAYSYLPSLFGTTLNTIQSGFVISINMYNKILYSYKRNYGENAGSFIKLVMDGFSNLFGCGATLSNRATSFTSPFFCKVQSSNELRIYAREDIAMTGYLFITLFTTSIPASVTYKLWLFDKYESSSQYALSVYVSQSFSRTKSGYNIVKPTSILWRKQAYKEYRAGSGPIRFTFKNNYQYVYDFSTPANSDGISVYYPGGISSSDDYVCFIKEYQPEKKYLRKEYYTRCYYETTNTIRLSSIPSHILQPQNEYEVAIYKNNNGSVGHFTHSTSDYNLVAISTRSSTSTSTSSIAMKDLRYIKRYRQVYPITLNHIYILTKEAAAINSLYISFSISQAGSGYHYFEFQFDTLGLSSFEIDDGEQIPCSMYGAFGAIGGSSIKPICKGYGPGVEIDSPLIIRVMSITSFSAGSTFQISFDNYNNPAYQKLFLVPISVQISYINRANNDIWTSYFPNIYASDSIDIGVPTNISSSFSMTNDDRGASSIHQTSFTWPYSSTYSDISQKIVMKIQGGITCCQSYSNFVLDDNRTGATSFQQMWKNTVANITVYRMPSLSVYSTTLMIRNVVNPYPIQKETYEQIRTIQILFYMSNKHQYLIKLNQPSYSSTYQRLSEINVDTDFALTSQTRLYDYHQAYPMTYDIEYSFSRNSFAGRQLKETILQFTAGVLSIERAQMRYTLSPYIVNPLLAVTIFRNSNNNWCLRISGMKENFYSTSYQWVIRMRFYPNANTLTYTSSTYAANGQLQFTNSDSEYLYGDNFNSSGYAPNKFQLYEQRYNKGYYELKRSYLYAQTGSTTNRLAFRFIPPYNITELQTFDLKLKTLTHIIPATANTKLTCIVQKSVSSKTILGSGLYCPCSFSSSNYMYSIQAPKGGLAAGYEYTFSVLEDAQLISSFNMPVTPAYQEISFIYNSELGLQFGDTYSLDFMGLLNSFSVNHRTIRKGTRNIIGFTVNSRFDLPAASTASSFSQSVIEIEFSTRYFPQCLDLGSVFTNDGQVFESGAFYTHYSEPERNDSSTRILCGQYSQSYSPAKLRITDYGAITRNNNYYFRFPLITNPSGLNAPLVYKVRLLSYENSKYYPKIIGYYEYNNLQQTVDGYADWRYIRLQEDSNDLVQNSVGIYVGYDSYAPPLNAEVILKFKTNDVRAFTSLSALNSLSVTNFGHYEFYHHINLCLFRKTTSTTDYTINLGTHPTSIDQQQYTISYVYSYHSSTYIYTSNFNIGSQDGSGAGAAVSAILRYYPSWSATSFTRDSGSTNIYSSGVYTISFKSDQLQFPEGSYIIITIDSEFLIEKDECKSLSGFLPGTIYRTSNLICRKQSSTTLRIAGYRHISQGSALAVTLYLQVVYNAITTRSPNAQIVVYSAEGNKIIDAGTSSYSLSIGNYGSYDFSLNHKPEQWLREGTAVQFDIQFKLATHTLTTGSYIALDFGNWTIDPALTQGRVIWKYKVGANIYWVPSEVTNPANNLYHIPVFSNYSMTAGQTIVLRVRHELPDSLYGIYFPNNQWSYLTIEAYNSAHTRLQHQYKRVWIQPYNPNTLVVTPVLKYVNAVTMYEISLTPNISSSSGDILSLEFTTSDSLLEDLFAQDLGKTIGQNQSAIVSCHESNHAHVISDQRIKCQLFKGNISADLPIPAVIQVSITKPIPAGTQIKLTLLDLKNPNQSQYPVGVTAKLMNLCVNMDINNPCTYFKSTQYLYFNNAPSIPAVTTHGTLTFNPNLVSATNTQQTFTGSYSIDSGDYLKIIYHTEVKIPEICSITSGNGICYSYPLENIILIKATSAQAGSYSFTLGGMTNLYRTKYMAVYPYTEIWDVSTGEIRARFTTNNLWTNHITQDPTSGQPLSITFTPTLTPDYELKYGFNNIARVQISHLMQNKEINMIYIAAGSEISFVTTYCNATLESDSSQADPYPMRFECVSFGSQSLRLLKQSNFPEWRSDFTQKKIILYLKYTISNSKYVTSNTWNAYAYTLNSIDSNYLVSQATGNFPIIQYLSPFIYKINFPTQAFSKRTCRTNQICMFYGYLFPSTPVAPVPVQYMTYTIPSEFGYSNLTQYNCKLQQKNDDYNPITCAASRHDSDLIMKFTPTYYNHNYKLVTIDATDQTMLFKAPSYPGTHYQMKVDLYSSGNALMESMMVNLTTVYGDLLEYTQIYVLIPLDAEAIGLFEFKFRVGNVDILPAYENNADNRITSAIEFEFSKSFEDDLGTEKYSGDEVGCLPISGITVHSTGKLTCKIYPSTSSITYPIIIVTGYDRILNGTDVVIRVAKLKSLPAGIEDYVKIGVSLTYYNYGGVKGYIYEPTGYVVGGTSLAASPILIDLTVSQVSTNFVGEFVNYDFTLNIGAGASTITTNDYIAVQFQENVFEGQFSQNLKAVCSLATATKCDSYGLSGIIYFKPSADISTSSLAFSINSCINSAYSLQYVNVTFKVFTVIDNKVNAVGTTELLKFSKPSPNISALVTRRDSAYGGDSEINYYLEFQMNHNLPKTGMILIEVPSIYQSLFALHSSCILSKDFEIETTCEVTNSHLIVIRANGVFLLPEFSYSLTITNMTNPNINLGQHPFKITSSFNDNVYEPLIISQSTFASPEISIVAVKSCETFEVTLSAYNTFIEANYQISLICATYIKQASEIRFYLSWSPQQKVQKCTSSTDSLYSYSCSIANEFRRTEKVTYLGMYLQGISPQKLIMLNSAIINGQMGNYKITAEVSYKGFTYISTTSNQFFIKSSTVQTISNSDIQFNHYPINRNYDSIYTVKIPNPHSLATDMVITLPPSILPSLQKTIKCTLLDQDTLENYVQLLKLASVNQNLTCSLTNSLITISNISKVIQSLQGEDFLRLSISKLKNPNLSTTSQLYKIKFINSETGFGTVLSSGQFDVPSRISDPPVTLQINQINLQSQKFLVRNIYKISASSSASPLKFNQKTILAVIVTFPSQYQSILPRIESAPLINSTFGTAKYSNISYLSGLKLISEYTVTNGISFTNFSLEFEFVNPNVALNCSSDSLFQITIIDLKYNSILGESLANNAQCPLFNDRLYVINVTGKNRIQEGTIEQFTISIQKPAMFLNITPVMSTPAISIEPSSIIFKDYNGTIKKFKVKVLNSISGTFKMELLKKEQNKVFYSSIASQSVTVVPSTKQYAVKFSEVDAKSVGLPIDLVISLEMENSRELTLVYTHNCSTAYIFSPPSYLTIAQGTTKTKITVTQNDSVINPMCSISLEISSLTTSRYYLPVKTLYISASKSAERGKTIPPMRLKITQKPQNSQDIGSVILTDTGSIKPEFYEISETYVGSNTANFTSAVSDNGTVYFSIMKIGTNRNQVTQSDIYQKSVPTGVIYGFSQTSTNNQASTIFAELTAEGLESQTSYLIGAYINTTIGVSDLIFEVFHTKKSSNGAIIKIEFSEIYGQQQIIEALEKVLRIDKSRIAVLTITETLNQIQTQYVSAIMNQRTYIYQIVVGPNRQDDSVTSLETLMQLVQQEAVQQDLQEFLPAFNPSYKMTTHQIILNVPQFREPGAQIISASHETIQIKAQTWQRSNITAVIVPEPSNDLLAVQVADGTDQDNNKLDVEHYASGITDQEGYIELQFTLLTGDKEYSVFISAECVVPYEGTLRVPDNKVERLQVRTAKELNTKGSQQSIIESLKEKYPELSTSVSEQVKRNQIKRSITKPSQITAWRNGKKTRRIKKHP